MGIFFQRLRELRPPIVSVSEHIMGLPAGSGLVVQNFAFKVIYIIAGEAKITIDGEDRYSVTAGDLLVLPKPCHQKYDTLGSGGVIHTVLLQFDPFAKGLVGADAAFSRYLETHFSRPRHCKTNGSFAAWDLVSRLRREGDAKDELSLMALQEIMKQFLFQSAEWLGIHRPPPLSKEAARVEETCSELVRQVYALQSIRPIIAEPSPLIQAQLGMTLSRLVATVRVERAKEEMSHSTQSLTSIARRLGFVSLSTFSRTFRTVTGLSPRHFLQRLHDQDIVEPTESPAWASPSLVPLSGTWKAEVATLLCCLAGDLEAQSGKLSVPLSAIEPTVLLVRAGSRWKFAAAGEARVLALPLGALNEAKGIGNLLCRVKRGRDLDAVRRYAADGSEHGRLVSESLLKSAAVEVLRQVRREGGPEKPSEASSSITAKRLPVDYAREFIRKNYRRDITLSEIAWFAGVSEEHLSRIFRRVDGKSVMQFLLEHRLRCAKGLLKETQKTVAAIAEASGFASSVSFCRAFRKAEGCTPGEFRRTARLCKG